MNENTEEVVQVVKSGPEETFTYLYEDKFQMEDLENRTLLLNDVIERTNIDESFYDKQYRVEYYFLPEEAKKIGAADYIVGKDCSLNDIL